jgi:hypothetical protein
MPHRSSRPVVLFACLAGQFAAPVAAQSIVAQTAGIPNPTHVFDFGANALPNFTPVTTQFGGLTIAHAAYFTTGSINNLVGGFLTNDFTAGPPSTLRIQLAQPVVDASFVFHQVASGTTTTMRALLQGVPVAAFAGSWNQAQPNNYFGFTNTLLDELQIDFVSDFNFDTLAVRSAAAACVVRNGSGVNPAGFGCATLPRVGTQWQGTVATQANTLLSVMAYGAGGFGAPLPLFGGELLLDPSAPLLTFTGAGSHGFAIPAGTGFLGVSLPLQGARLDLVGGAPAIVLLNGIELIVGL